jgi:hypothetical protein
MSTLAKIESNRANAQHSTGPRTPEGKARVSQNAVKHGLTSSKLFIRDDEHEEFTLFAEDLHSEILPMGALEEDLHARILHAAWNLRRLRQLEEALFADCDDPFTDEQAAQKMSSYARHTARFERTYRNALRELRQLQTNRNLATAASGTGPVVLTPVVDVAKLLKQSQRSEHERSENTHPASDPDSGIEDLATLREAIARDSEILDDLESE